MIGADPSLRLSSTMVLKLPSTVRSRGLMVGSGLAALLGSWMAPHLSAVPAQAQTGVAPVIRIEGSSTVFPLMEEAARAFQGRPGAGSVSIALKETGS